MPSQMPSQQMPAQQMPGQMPAQTTELSEMQYEQLQPEAQNVGSFHANANGQTANPMPQLLVPSTWQNKS